MTTSSPPSPLDPDEVGYVKPSQAAIERGKALSHTPDMCRLEHCACHLPTVFSPPNLELSGREALVLAWHLFPLGDDEELSFEEIGAKLGVTVSRVRQIYMRAGAKIRAYPRSHYPPKPGTDEYEKRMAAAQEYRTDHPEYADRRALLDAHAAYEAENETEPTTP